jgi:hypothetical protein
MRPVTLTLLLCLLALAPACSSEGGARDANASKPAAVAADAPPATPAAQAPQSKTCALLTAEELKEVQGESPTDTQGSEHASGPLSMSQCFFRLPTFSKSVNVEVVRADAAALKDYWRKRFHPDAVEARARERESEEEREREREEELKRERAAGQVREGGHEREEERGGDEEDSRPQRVPGLGEEAYLTGNRINATLFVLKSDAVLRVSVGGPEDRPAKLKKAAALAAKALKRM